MLVRCVYCRNLYVAPRGLPCARCRIYHCDECVCRLPKWFREASWAMPVAFTPRDYFTRTTILSGDTTPPARTGPEPVVEDVEADASDDTVLRWSLTLGVIGGCSPGVPPVPRPLQSRCWIRWVPGRRAWHNSSIGQRPCSHDWG